MCSRCTFPSPVHRALSLFGPALTPGRFFVPHRIWDLQNSYLVIGSGRGTRVRPEEGEGHHVAIRRGLPGQRRGLAGRLHRPGGLGAGHQTGRFDRRGAVRMVQRHLVERGIKDPRVLEAFRTVPRHLYVPPDKRRLAYEDESIPIGEGQTITPPYDVAFMTEALEPKPTDKVYEVGTGSGYQASILSRLVQDVYSVEIHRPLGERAAKVIKDLGYDNVHMRVGDGYAGWPEEAPFDAIIVTCAPQSIPTPLIDQLKEGGRMVIPLGNRYLQKVYVLVKQDGKMVGRPIRGTLFVPMTGRASASRRRARRRPPSHPEPRNDDRSLTRDLIHDAPSPPALPPHDRGRYCSHNTGLSCRRSWVPRVPLGEPVSEAGRHGFPKRNPWHPRPFPQGFGNQPGILATVSRGLVRDGPGPVSVCPTLVGVAGDRAAGAAPPRGFRGRAQQRRRARRLVQPARRPAGGRRRGRPDVPALREQPPRPARTRQPGIRRRWPAGRGSGRGSLGAAGRRVAR